MRKKFAGGTGAAEVDGAYNRAICGPLGASEFLRFRFAVFPAFSRIEVRRQGSAWLYYKCISIYIHGKLHTHIHIRTPTLLRRFPFPGFCLIPHFRLYMISRLLIANCLLRAEFKFSLYFLIQHAPPPFAKSSKTSNLTCTILSADKRSG